MATLTIRNLEEDLKSRLRIEAAQHGNSMEEEARLILRKALGKNLESGGLGSQIHALFKSIAAPDLDIPKRDEPPRAADLSE